MKHVSILGGGSAAFTAAHQALDAGWHVTVVNTGLPLGGTCLNVGCVPSKAYIRAAEALYHANHSRFAGIESSAKLTDFAKVFREKQDIVDTLRRINYEEVVPTLENFELVEGQGLLMDAHTIAVDDRRIETDTILIATGSHTFVPPVPGIENTPYLTNDTLYKLHELPQSAIVLGGRYIALECAQMLSRFGVKVTVLQRSGRILPDQTEDLTDTLTELLDAEGLHIETGVTLKEISGNESRVTVATETCGEEKTFTAEKLLVATGRRANTAGMGLEEAGVETRPDGSIQTTPDMQTTLPGVYAAGDVAGDPMFVYTASYEAEIAIKNAMGSERKEVDYTGLPWVIFTDPQLAGAGVDEQQAEIAGIDFDVAVLPAIRVPRLRVGHDDRGFIKLIRNRQNDKLIGGRFLCHEAGELSMQASLAIRYGITVDDLCNLPHPYLTLSEAIQRTAARF